MILSDVFLNTLIPGKNFKAICFYEGYDHSVIEVSDSSGCAYIFRQIRLDGKFGQAQGADMACEVALLKTLEGKIKACSVPKVLYYFPEHDLMGYAKLAGNHLTPALYEALSSSEQAALAHMLAQAIFELHSAISVPDAQSFGLEHVTWPLSAQVLKEKLSASSDFACSGLGEFFAAFCAEYAAIERDNCYPDVVLSNDIHSKNILIDQGRHTLSALIDFTDCAIGSPFLEFRHLYLVSPQFFESTLTVYCVKRGWKVDSPRARMYYLATEFSRLVRAYEGDQAYGVQAILDRIFSYLNEH